MCVVTPTGNPQALDARRKRNPYDELDLDQTYPGNPGGLVSERLAHALMSEIRGVADVLINLHTMNPLFDARPYTVYKVHPDSRVTEADVLAAMAPFHPHVACQQDVGGKGNSPAISLARSTINAWPPASARSCSNWAAAAASRPTTSRWRKRVSTRWPYRWACSMPRPPSRPPPLPAARQAARLDHG